MNPFYFKQRKLAISKMITALPAAFSEKKIDDVNLFNAPIWWDYEKRKTKFDLFLFYLEVVSGQTETFCLCCCLTMMFNRSQTRMETICFIMQPAIVTTSWCLSGFIKTKSTQWKRTTLDKHLFLLLVITVMQRWLKCFLNWMHPMCCGMLFLKIKTMMETLDFIMQYKTQIWKVNLFLWPFWILFDPRED